MDLHQYLDAVRKYWWAILAPTVLVARVHGLRREPSGAVLPVLGHLLHHDPWRGHLPVSGAGRRVRPRRVNSYVALLSTERLAEMVVADSGVDLTPGEVRGMITASGDLDTVLLKATVTSTSEDLALELTESIATQFVTLVSEVEGGAEQGSVTLQVVSGPSVPSCRRGRW